MCKNSEILIFLKYPIYPIKSMLACDLKSSEILRLLQKVVIMLNSSDCTSSNKGKTVFITFQDQWFLFKKSTIIFSIIFLSHLYFSQFMFVWSYTMAANIPKARTNTVMCSPNLHS